MYSEEIGVNPSHENCKSLIGTSYSYTGFAWCGIGMMSGIIDKEVGRTSSSRIAPCRSRDHAATTKPTEMHTCTLLDPTFLPGRTDCDLNEQTQIGRVIIEVKFET